MIDIAKITDYLYIGASVGEEHLDDLRVLKVDLIISMIGQFSPPKVFGQPPFALLWLKTFDTFLTPIGLTKLKRGVTAALPIIEKGGCVLVYCIQGRRRSVIMGAAILIALGHSAAQATELLIKGRNVADPRRWYVRWQIQNFENYWKRQQVIKSILSAGVKEGADHG